MTEHLASLTLATLGASWRPGTAHELNNPLFNVLLH
jgi:hypothetical protein